MGVRIERDDAVAWLLIDNPPANQIDPSVHAELLAALDRLAADEGLRVLVLSGAGEQSFCAGADIRGLPAGAAPGEIEAYAAAWDELYRKVREFPCPTVAAVNGYAFGGGFELLLSTDLRVAAAHARMGCTAANLGLITSLHSLMAQLPPVLARELFFTARHLPADEAYRLGIVNRVVPMPELAGAVRELTAAMLARAPLALRAGKRLMGLAPLMDRASHDELQRQAFVALARSEDHREAVRAFLEKRKPTFEGK